MPSMSVHTAVGSGVNHLLPTGGESRDFLLWGKGLLTQTATRIKPSTSQEGNYADGAKSGGTLLGAAHDLDSVHYGR
jgi:hypothetical protein